MLMGVVKGMAAEFEYRCISEKSSDGVDADRFWNRLTSHWVCDISVE